MPFFALLKTTHKRKKWLLEVQVLGEEKFKNSCERGSPCIQKSKIHKKDVVFCVLK